MIKAMQKRLMIIAILLFVICNKIAAADQVTISDFSIFTGQTKDVSISLANDKAYAAFQFDLVLPEGVTVVMPESPDTWNNHKSDRIPSTTDLSMQQLSDGSYRFVAMPGTTTIQNISGSEGVIINLTLSAAATAAVGNQTGYFRNIKLSTSDGEAVNGKTISEQSFTFTVRGDEAYAVISDENTKLTFYYDKLKDTRGGVDIVVMETFDDVVSAKWHNEASYITQVVFDETMNSCTSLTSTAFWFYGFSSLESIDFSNLNTDNVKDMKYMFAYCHKLTSIQFGDINTANVESMAGMFYYSSLLPSLDLSKFNTAKVKSMSSMFEGCDALASIELDVLKFNTENVETMDHMFYRCGSLTNIDLSNFNTAKVTNMFMMFYDCNNLTSLDLGSFNTAAVTDMGKMFWGCSKLTTIYVSSEKWSTASIDEGVVNVFYDCSSIVGGAGTTYHYSNVGIDYAHIDGGTSDPGYFTDVQYKDAVAEPYAVLSNENTTLTFYYDKRKGARSGLGVGPFNAYFDRGWETYRDGITSIVIDESMSSCTTVTSTAWWFDGCYNAAFTGLNNLNTENVTNMHSMFTGCSFTSVDLSSFDTQKVTDMSDMFYQCTALTSLDLSNFKTENVTNMGSMFKLCKKLESITINKTFFKTENVTNMSEMFNGCQVLTSIDVSGFNTSNVTNMDRMFSSCMALTSLDLSSFNTSSVTNMTDMFSYAKIPALDLSSFNTSSVTSMYQMFAYNSELETIYVGDNWTTTNVTSDVMMFHDCTKLVGGEGTVYSTGHVDKTYARIDGGTTAPGYFTNVIYKGVEDEPYAVLTDNSDVVTTDNGTVNGKTLTFYYDKKKATRGGMSVVHVGSQVEIGWYDSNNKITKVVFDDSFENCTSLTSTNYWFYGCSNLASITGIAKLKTSNVTSMESMFWLCSNLTSLDVSNFDVSNVESFYGMFWGCRNLTSLDLSNWMPIKATSFNRMFANCSSLTDLDLSSFNTPEATDMSFMIANCSSLKNVDLSGINTSKVTNMNSMFSGSSALESIDISNFNTESVTDMDYMFSACVALITIYVGDSWKTTSVVDGNNMFWNCPKLVGGQGTTYNSEHADYSYAHIDVSGNPGYFTNVIYKGVEAEPYAVMSNENKTMTFYYDKEMAVRGGMSAMNYWEWDSYRESITQVVFDETMANCTSLTSTAGWFKDCSKLTTITGLANLKTENVSEMQQMFQGCSSLRSLDLSTFVTQNVITMFNMFGGCSSLTSINLSNFDTSNVVYLGNMFRECSSLSTLDLSSFTTPKVTNIEAMFYECTNLTTIYVSSNWYTELITEGTNMFIGCQKLIGGRGAVFDANHTDYTYARIDGGSDNPGYFTDKYGVTLTAKDYTRKYGEANPTFEYTVEGAEFSGTPTITCTATTTSDAGTYPITITYDATGTGLNITCINGTLTITKAPLKVAAKSYTIKRGSAIPTFEVEYSGFVNNETNTVLTKKAVATCEAKSDTVPGTYEIVVSGAEAKNYEMEYVYGSLTITDDAVVTAKDYTREYGEANPTFEYTVDGAILEGKPAITCEATETSPVGTYDITIAKGDITNSDVTYVKGTLTITKAPLTITAKSYSIKQGKDLPTLELEYSGFKNNETDTVFTTKPTVTTRATSYSNPGTYDITVSGAEAANYEIKYVNGTLTITEKTETFDGNVLTVDEGGNIDDAFENMGGREEAAKTIAAIIWNASEPLTDDMLEGIDNPNLLVYVSDKKLAPEKVRNVVVDGVAKYISLTNDSTKNCNFYVPEEFKADSIVYTREFKQTTKKNVSRGWEGIVLPFTVQTFSHETHGEIAPFGNTASKYHFWLHAITENGVIDATTIEANKPYIISMPNSEEYTAEFNQAGLVTFASADVKVPATETSDVWLNDSVVIIPTFQRVEKYDMVYALNVLYDFDDFKEGSVFVSNYRDVRPFEIYTFHENHHHKGAEARLFSVSSLFGGNGTTGIIDTMKTAEPNGEKWYDMNGHRLQGKPARKGVYIMNGKKVIVK